jgi:hypothetical protein
MIDRAATHVVHDAETCLGDDAIRGVGIDALAQLGGLVDEHLHIACLEKTHESVHL